MLIAVVTMFIVCEFPDLVLRIAVTAIEFRPEVELDSDDDVDAGVGSGDIHDDRDSLEQFDETDAIRCVNAITNSLLTANSALSFVVYCAVGRKFRDTLLTMCQGRQVGRSLTGRTSLPEVSEADPFAAGASARRVTVEVCRDTLVAVETVIEAGNKVTVDSNG